MEAFLEEMTSSAGPKMTQSGHMVAGEKHF